MNRKILIIALAGISSIHLCLAQDSHEYADTDGRIEQLSEEIRLLKAQKRASDNEILQLKSVADYQQAQIDSLKSVTASNEKEINATRQASIDSIGVAHQYISDATTRLSSALNAKYLIAIGVGILSFVVAICIYIVYRKKVDTLGGSFSKMESMREELDNKIAVSDSKLFDIIEKQLSVVEKMESARTEVDHSLAIAVANDLTRIQQNLNHMDSSVKGVSQLKNRANSILSTLNSKQYDIPNLLGRQYHEGDTIIATMELNEDMEIGTNRIKRVIKPQVSYAGKLIQAAEVVVEFNE